MLRELDVHRVAAAASRWLLLTESVRILGPSHDGAVERDLEHAESQLISAVRQLD